MEGSLSDNIIKAHSTKVIYAFKVKQFIKELKEAMDKHWLEECHDCSCNWKIPEALNALAGEKLI